MGGRVMFKNIFKKKKTALPVKESIQTVMMMITERFSDEGWKYIKGRREIKKNVGDLNFIVAICSSKWNTQGQTIRLQFSASVECKKYKVPQKHLLIYTYEPLDSKLADGYKWYDITYQENFENVVNDICFQLSGSIVVLAREFERDFIAAGIKLARDGLLYTYDSIFNDDSHNDYISIRFIDEYIGRQYAREMAIKYYSHINEEEKEKLKEYLALYKKGITTFEPYIFENERYIIKHFEELIR